jgi:hypothetical protein
MKQIQMYLNDKKKKTTAIIANHTKIPLSEIHETSRQNVKYMTAYTQTDLLGMMMHRYKLRCSGDGGRMESLRPDHSKVTICVKTKKN